MLPYQPLMKTHNLLAVGLVAALAIHGTAQNRPVQVGFCTTLANLAAAKAAGFDYVELGTSEIAALSDAAFDEALGRIREAGVAVPATNLFLPATLKVTGPAADRDQQMAYVKKAFARLERIGTHIVVFGSGGARQVPEGFAKDQAFQQLVDFGRRIAPEAKAHGITVAVEPLRTQETNIINSAAEGLALVNAIADPNFQLMVTSTSSRQREGGSRDHRARQGSHPAPPHGKPRRTRVPALAGRVRLRAVLRRASDNRLRRAYQRGSVDERSQDRGAAGDRVSANQVPVAVQFAARLCLTAPGSNGEQ
jgi:hypothetical protein